MTFAPAESEAWSACQNASCSQFEDFGTPAPCVAAIVEDSSTDRLLFAKRAVEPALGKWDTLGGFVKPGESLEDALRNEVSEESQLVVRKFWYLGSYPGVYEYRGLRIPTANAGFAVQVEAFDLAIPGSDVSQLEWFHIDELPQLAFEFQGQLLADWRQWKARGR
jgi:NADH pyrophosphatase NudC (nudix superfamily)